MPMVVIRALSLLLALAFFFIIAAPLQGLLIAGGSKLSIYGPRLFCRTLLRILRVSTVVEGTVVIDGPVLIASNHVSWIDVLVLGSVLPFCFLAKREVASWPVLSRFAKVQKTVFVDRRRRGIVPANRDMAARMLEGYKVLLFPEGTTFDGRVPGPFLSSHFAAARELLRQAPERESVTVQAAALAYSTPAAAWVGDDALLPHVWRILRGPPILCVLGLGEALPYRLASDRKIVARNARDSVIEMLARTRLGHPDLAWCGANDGDHPPPRLPPLTERIAV